MENNTKQNWRTIDANSNLIQTETEKALLIKLPKEDYKFWYPKALCETSGRGAYKLSIRISDDTEVKIFKSGKGRYNKFEKIDEQTIDADELESYFTRGND